MSRADTRPGVVHYRERFPVASETFVHETVAAHRRYSPTVVTHAQSAQPVSQASASVLVEPERGGRGVRAVPALRIRARRAALRRALGRVSADLVHAHFGEEGVVAAPVAGSRGLPLIVTFYGYDATSLGRRRSWRRRFRRLFRRARFVLAEGPFLRQRLIRLGCPPDRARIQPIPVRLDLFPFEPRVPPDDGAFVLLQACRFVEKKGVDLTLRAFARVAAEWPAAELRLLGDGPERSGLERLVDDLDLGTRVRFLGMCSHEEYAAALRQAHIFVHPSRTASNGDGEGGAPTALLEAQALGLPIVASDHADIPNVVAPDGALLAPEGDVDAIAGHMDRLMRHPGEWVSRAGAGRSVVAKRHDPEVLSARLEDLYDEAVEASPVRDETRRRSAGGTSRPPHGSADADR